MKRIAIIGSGISGIGAAYALKDTADITLFEAQDRLGGHACTHVFDYDGHETAVDLGFIVYNGLNYPNLIGLFDALGVKTQESDMSFAVSDRDGWEWASTARGIFELAAGRIEDTTLGDWLDFHGFDQAFRCNYILPMGAAIWSTPEVGMLDYPARSFFQFFENHRLMHKERPQWRTVTGGSQSYVKAAAAELGDRVRTGTPAIRVFPFGDKITVITADNRSHVFDDVILATHSDQALRLVEKGFEDQSFLLRSVHYRPNTIYLHRDPALMPSRRAAWASWNVIKQDNGDICLSYWMNRLQGLDDSRPLFITLNPETAPRPELTFHQYAFDHPQFDTAAEAAVRGLKRIQGQDGLWIAGAWMGRGFHEDGLKSGLSAALSLGGRVPWDAKGVDIHSPSRKTPVMEIAAEVSV